MTPAVPSAQALEPTHAVPPSVSRVREFCGAGRVGARVGGVGQKLQSRLGVRLSKGPVCLTDAVPLSVPCPSTNAV